MNRKLNLFTTVRRLMDKKLNYWAEASRCLLRKAMHEYFRYYCHVAGMAVGSFYKYYEPRKLFF